MATFEAKTFQEIWAQLSDEQRADVRLKLLTKKCTASPQSIYNWAAGRTRPTNPLVLDAIANTLGQYLGVKLYGRVLFPAKSSR